MSHSDQLVHLFYKALVHTVMLPLRNQAFESTRKAKISDTEKEALSSGSVGFEREFLSGHPDWSKLLDMPAPQLRPDEIAFLNGPVEQLCAMLDDWEIRSKTHDLPPEAWDFMKRQGFFGMIIPKDYGGLGFSAQAHSDVVQKLASRCTTACVTAMVPNSLGPAELLIRYGTNAQKDYYLPRLARGEEVPSFALTEPDAGSDASSMTSRGVVVEQDGVLGILLNWDKRYITLSPITTLLGLAFKLEDPQGLLGGPKNWGITLALIPVDKPGIQIGRRHNPLGIPFQNGPTQGKDVWIPMEFIIGGQQYAGQGWRMLMECLSVGRCISLPALSAGTAKLICRITGAYSRVRRQFKVSINQFEGVEELLARMAGSTYLMEAARVATLQMLDRGEHPTILSAVLKYHMTEYGRKIVNDGMDILGGKAICEGPGNLISSLYHAIPIGITVEGANILTRNMIIFGQGSVRSHPFLLKEIEAARLENRNEAKKQFSDWMARHVRQSVENTFGSIFYGVMDGSIGNIPPGAGPERSYFRHINRLSAAYALLADTALMVLGDSVKRKERISALLGDTMSYLYLASCTLRHFIAQGRLAEDIPLMHWACQHSLYKAEESMDLLLQNFPLPWIAVLLRLAVFPRGRRFKSPSHRLERQVSKALINPGSLRDRLTEGIYLPTSLEEPLAILEQCFAASVASEPSEIKLRKAIKEGLLDASDNDLLGAAMAQQILSQEEAETLKLANVTRRRVIDVDDFDLNFGTDTDRKPALADGKSLKAVYPLGTQWNLSIPRIDLVQLLEKSIAQYKYQPCLDSLGKKYSYQEVGALVNKAAAGLQAMGIQSGDKVGLYMPNTPYYPIMFLAALKVGAVVVNFCPMHTYLELKEQAEDSGTKVMVTLDLKDIYENSARLQREGVFNQLILCRMEEALPFLKAQAYRMMRSEQIARPEISENTSGESIHTGMAHVWFKDLIGQRKPFIPVALSPDDIAVLQYTGGTTGTPKGAMLTHYNLVANILQLEAYFAASANKPDVAALLQPGKEKVLSTIPYFHIFGMTVAMLVSMKLGGELLILPDPRNIREALKTIQEKKPTLFPAIPRLLQAISENSKAGTFDLGNLETVISGGAALPEGVKDSFEGITGKPGIIKQGYGLTEAAPVVSGNPPFGLNKPESVGLPLPMTRIKITDPDDIDSTLAIGEVGEICISGPQVMHGYYQREDETRAVISDGWLRTGDIGFLDEDYFLHIVDRKKRLILVNGLNVYPTQIENAIGQHPAVAECIVVSVPDSRSGEAAKAFIRLRKNKTLSIGQIRDFLSDLLSRVEIPKHIEFVDSELPKTAVGKPDWRLLQDGERLKHVEFGSSVVQGDFNHDGNRNQA